MAVQEKETDDISLRQIDTDDLREVEDNREAIEFMIHLSTVPSEAWQQEFEQAYLHTPYVLKPPVTINGDALHIIYLPRYAAELAGFVRFLGLIVRRANEEVIKTEQIQYSSAQEKRRAEFRDALRRVELPK